MADDKQSVSSTPKSLEFSQRGVKTSADFANLMSALMSDLLAGTVTPQVGNAACNAGGKLLKIIEMQHRYGTPDGKAATERVISLASGV